jgi:hypothetical protein
VIEALHIEESAVAADRLPIYDELPEVQSRFKVGELLGKYIRREHPHEQFEERVGWGFGVCSPILIARLGPLFITLPIAATVRVIPKKTYRYQPAGSDDARTFLRSE